MRSKHVVDHERVRRAVLDVERDGSHVVRPSARAAAPYVIAGLLLVAVAVSALLEPATAARITGAALLLGAAVVAWLVLLRLRAPRRLTVLPDGLRIERRDALVEVPWADVGGCERTPDPRRDDLWVELALEPEVLWALHARTLWVDRDARGRPWRSPWRPPPRRALRDPQRGVVLRDTDRDCSARTLEALLTACRPRGAVDARRPSAAIVGSDRAQTDAPRPPAS